MKGWLSIVLHTLFPFLDSERQQWRVAMEDQLRASRQQNLFEREMLRGRTHDRT